MKYRRQRLGGNKSGVTVVADQVQAEVPTDTPPAGTAEATEKQKDGVDLLVKAVDALNVADKRVI
jgi:hypothetical protein